MPRNPLHDVAIVGICNSKQARILEGETSETIILEAIRGVLAETGLAPHEVDIVRDWIRQLPEGIVAPASQSVEAPEVEAIEDELLFRLRSIQRAALLCAGKLPDADAMLLNTLCEGINEATA